MGAIPVLQHIDCESLGRIEDALRAAQIPFRYVRGFAGEPVPESIGECPALIVLGGPMGVYESDRFPFLKSEMKLVESALKAGRPILGVCLGSQLLAQALGARVRPGPHKEIGWHPVHLTEEGKRDGLLGGAAPRMALHWHGDIFDCPAGAETLAYSDWTAVQAYRYGRNAYGFLFHTEVTAPMIREWVSRFSEELAAADIPAAPILEGIDAHLPDLEASAGQIFGRWSALVA